MWVAVVVGRRCRCLMRVDAVVHLVVVRCLWFEVRLSLSVACCFVCCCSLLVLC